MRDAHLAVCSLIGQRACHSAHSADSPAVSSSSPVWENRAAAPRLVHGACLANNHVAKIAGGSIGPICIMRSPAAREKGYGHAISGIVSIPRAAEEGRAVSGPPIMASFKGAAVCRGGNLA